MWINSEVNLPSDLIAAQRDGRLVVFAGAGVSMGVPSNLPSFQDLADSVVAGAVAKKDGEALDAFLGRAEQKGIDVQTRVRYCIDRPDSTPRALHHLLVGLFRDESSVRLVTTNFDRHFTTALRAKYAAPEIFIGPALPLGRECAGLVYLHGAVERSRGTLVITDRDFGLAYLADGWATRFLMEMFGSFVVLFVGYSHEDPVMRYLARSFVGATSRFAITAPGKDDHWTGLGIVPVHVPLRPDPHRYSGIDEAIEAWTKTGAMGVFDHKARLTQLASAAPPLEPETVDYLRATISEEVHLRSFLDEARRAEWLTWAESEGLLAPLTKLDPITSAKSRLLAHWFAERFAVSHCKEALQFVQRHAQTLNPIVTEAIAFHVCVSTATPPADVLRLWAAALIMVPATPTSALVRFLGKCADTGDIATAMTLFRLLIRPRLQLDATWAGLREATDPEPSLDAKVSMRGPAFEMRRAWDKTLKANIPGWYRELLDTTSDWCHEALGLLRAAGKADDWDPLSFQRSAIEPHGQDHTSDEWGLAVDVARDVLDYALEHEPAVAAALDSWCNAKPLLLRRLAIYGMSRRKDLAPEQALELIEQRGWLDEPFIKHEVFELIKATFGKAGDAAQSSFIAHSMSRDLPVERREDADAVRSSQYAKYNLAVWLNRVAPESAVATEHLRSLQLQHPEFGPREHPDMDHWIGSGFVGTKSPTTGDALAEMAVPDAAQYLASYEPDPGDFMGPDRSGLMVSLREAVAHRTEWAVRLAVELAAKKEWKRDVWSALVGSLRTIGDEQSFRDILELIENNHQIIDAAALDVANFLESASDREGLDDGTIQRIEQLGDRVLVNSDSIEPGVFSKGEIDWLTSAINHPAGQVALTWVKTIARRMAIAGDQWQGIPGPTRERLQSLAAGNGPSAQLARIIFASHVHFLFAADRAWTEAVIVPQFDWESNPARAAQSWEGFLFWGRWNDALFEKMAPFVRQTISHIDQLGEQADRFTSALAAVAAFSRADPWHHDGWLFALMQHAASGHRAHWAQEFGRFIQSLNATGKSDLWERWLAEYWNARITGVPQPLDDAEKRALVLWIVAAPNLQAAVELVLKAPPSTMNHFSFYQLKDTGIAAASGLEVGRLLRGVLAGLQTVEWDTGEVMDLARQAMEHGAEPADIIAVAQEMVRLGCGGADELHRLASGKIAGA